MKLEIRKETKANGDIFYHIYKNGGYFNTFGNVEKAEECFEAIKKNRGEEKIEIIKSEEI